MLISKPSPEDPVQICPYWHEVAADFASVNPAGGDCCRRLSRKAFAV